MRWQLCHLSAFALILSGIRRCGKSTLLFQLLKQRYPDALYLNFEDPRLYEFGPTGVTLDQTDRLEKSGKVVHVVPAHQYLSK